MVDTRLVLSRRLKTPRSAKDLHFQAKSSPCRRNACVLSGYVSVDLFAVRLLSYIFSKTREVRRESPGHRLNVVLSTR